MWHRTAFNACFKLARAATILFGLAAVWALGMALLVGQNETPTYNMEIIGGRLHLTRLNRIEYWQWLLSFSAAAALAGNFWRIFRHLELRHERTRNDPAGRGDSRKAARGGR